VDRSASTRKGTLACAESGRPVLFVLRFLVHGSDCTASEELWSDLTVPVSVDEGAAALDLSAGWQDRWLLS
jgi:hypothetical protein